VGGKTQKKKNGRVRNLLPTDQKPGENWRTNLGKSEKNKVGGSIWPGGEKGPPETWGKGKRCRGEKQKCTLIGGKRKSGGERRGEAVKRVTPHERKTKGR